MSGVARILLARGAQVSGSDVKESRTLAALRSMGAKIAVGHQAEHLTLSGELPTAVVISFTAIPKDNPELVAAQQAGIPLLGAATYWRNSWKVRGKCLSRAPMGKPPLPR